MTARSVELTIRRDRRRSGRKQVIVYRHDSQCQEQRSSPRVHPRSIGRAEL